MLIHADLSHAMSGNGRKTKRSRDGGGGSGLNQVMFVFTEMKETVYLCGQRRSQQRVLSLSKCFSLGEQRNNCKKQNLSKLKKRTRPFLGGLAILKMKSGGYSVKLDTNMRELMI